MKIGEPTPMRLLFFLILVSMLASAAQFKDGVLTLGYQDFLAYSCDRQETLILAAITFYKRPNSATASQEAPYSLSLDFSPPTSVNLLCDRPSAETRNILTFNALDKFSLTDASHFTTSSFFSILAGDTLREVSFLVEKGTTAIFKLKLSTLKSLLPLRDFLSLKLENAVIDVSSRNAPLVAFTEGAFQIDITPPATFSINGYPLFRYQNVAHPVRLTIENADVACLKNSCKITYSQNTKISVDQKQTAVVLLGSPEAFLLCQPAGRCLPSHLAEDPLLGLGFLAGNSFIPIPSNTLAMAFEKAFPAEYPSKRTKEPKERVAKSRRERTA